jgi:hypothetical protein
MCIPNEAPFHKAALTPVQDHASLPSLMPVADSSQTGIRINWWADKAETVDIRDDDVAVPWKANGISLHQGSPVPLWLEARARTIDFRRDDLERTHWKKICRSMPDD